MDEEDGELFDMEPDNNSGAEDVAALPRRVRFYHAKIDAGNLVAREDYSALRNVVVIFITTYDHIYGIDTYSLTGDTCVGNEVISEIAAAHGKSSAQVILRWNLQKGVIFIPGSGNPGHIQENPELFDFELTEKMERINALDRGEKHDWY